MKGYILTRCIPAIFTGTCATASAICRPRDLKPIRRKDLREICVGDWEQRTWGEIYRRTPAQMADFSTHPERWYVEGAETPAQVPGADAGRPAGDCRGK